MEHVVADQIDALFDSAIEQSSAFDFEVHDQPQKEDVTIEDTAAYGGPLRLDQQSIDGLRGVVYLFDKHMGIDSGLTPTTLVDQFIASGTSGLPNAVKPRRALPAGTKSWTRCSKSIGWQVERPRVLRVHRQV